MITVVAVRIISLGVGYEALIHLVDGSCHLITSDTLSGVLKEVEDCQVQEQK